MLAIELDLYKYIIFELFVCKYLFSTEIRAVN
jgi:hypothetical protein